jgi:pimeloyl-ACP methyl ester carboxylesterase
MSRTHFTWRAGVAAVSAIVLAACSAQASTSPRASEQTSRPLSASAVAAGSALPRIELPVGKGETVEGLVDVGGHDIYARCNGTGSPTVVYFTGWAPDASKLGVNVMDGTQAPEDIVADVDGVLEALGENGPLVLLGASFGGLVSGAYAVAHPDRVAAILLLDASTPEDYPIDERHGFDGMCTEANRQADAWESLEKIDNCRLAKWAYDRRDQEPDVPLIYLAAKDPSDRGDVADDPLRKAYVRGWSPGIWKSVQAPHWMDEADPELVVRNLKQVIALANGARLGNG